MTAVARMVLFGLLVASGCRRDGGAECWGHYDCDECSECVNGACVASARCIADAGGSEDAAEPDAAFDIGVADAEPKDAEPIDAEPKDAEPIDAEPMDAEPIEAGPRAKAIASGISASHSCAVLENGQLLCWGTHNFGELGIDADSYVPIPVQGLPPIDEVVIGNKHTCARAGGEVYCFGNNAKGQLGDQLPTSSTTTPHLVPGISDARQLASAGDHVCVLRAGDRVDCWGELFRSRVWKTPHQILGLPPDIESLHAGTTRMAVIAGGEMWIVGEGNCSQLGIPTTTTATIPTIVPIPGDVVSVGMGDLHSCAANDQGALYCWGCNGYGMVGTGDGDTRPAPVEVLPVGVRRVVAGLANTCAEQLAGDILCWGSNQHGTIADGQPIVATNIEWTPTPARTLPDASRVEILFYHACALYEGTVRCWGAGDFGVLGNGSTQAISTPEIIIPR